MSRIGRFVRVLPPAPGGERYGLVRGDGWEEWWLIEGSEQWPGCWSGCLPLGSVVTDRALDAGVLAPVRALFARSG